MKKICILAIMAIMGVTTASAQYEEAIQVAKSRSKAAKTINSSSIKPISADKKRAKELKNQGWMVMGSGALIEQQVANDRFLLEQEMIDDYGVPTSRYYSHSTTSIAESHSAAYLAARTACQNEVASQIETKIGGAFERQIANKQNGSNAISVDKLQSQIRGIVQGCLRNARPGMQLYRVNRNGNTEVMVTYIYDKKTIAQQLKEKLREELEQENEEMLNEAAEEAISSLK